MTPKSGINSTCFSPISRAKSCSPISFKMNSLFGLYLFVLSLAIKAAVTLTTGEPSTPVLPDVTTTDDITDSTTVTNTTTNIVNTQTSCMDGLQTCKDTFYNSDKKRQQALAFIGCVEAVKCDDNQEEHHAKMEFKNNALYWTKEDDEGKNGALKGNAGLTMTLIISLAVLAALKVNTIWKLSS